LVIEGLDKDKLLELGLGYLLQEKKVVGDR